MTLGAKVSTSTNREILSREYPAIPIIGNNVIIYSNASILGRITVGDNAIIGGNIWVTNDVAPGERLIQAKADNILRIKQ